MSYTPNFLTINGLEVRLTGFEEIPQDERVVERGGNTGLDGTIYALKRSWAFETEPLPPDEAEAVVGWIEGRGVQFSFDRPATNTTRFSLSADDGMVMTAFPTASSTAISRAAVWRSSDKKHGTWALQISGVSVSYDGTSTTHPFSYTSFTAGFGFGSAGKVSLSYWAKSGAVASYTLLSTIWDPYTSETTASFYVGTTATLPDANGLPFRTTSVFSSTVDYCSFRLLSGESINSVSTSLFDAVLLVPYALTSDMLGARNGRSAAEGPLPFVYIGGHALADPNEVLVKGFVNERQPTQCVIDGVFYDNAEILSGTLVEQ